MKDLSPILRSIGLLDSEIKTYLGALKKGPSTVIDLSKETKLSRQATYTAITALTDRGLMTSVESGKKTLYAAEDPQSLMLYARQYAEKLQGSIEELDALVPQLRMQSGGERPVVRLFEGKEGVRAIIEDYRSLGPEIDTAYEITDLDALYSVLSKDDLAELRKTLAKSKVAVKGIYSGTPGATEVNAERRVLPKEFAGFSSDIGVRGDHVTFATFKGKMYAVIINSPELAKTMRTLFELAYRGYEQLMEEKKKR